LGGVEDMTVSKTQVFVELTQDLRNRFVEGKGCFKGSILEDDTKKTIMELDDYVLRIYEVYNNGSFGDYFIEVVLSYYDENEDDCYYQVSGVGCVDGSNVRCCSYVVESKLESKDLFRCVACVISDLTVARRLEQVLDSIMHIKYTSEIRFHSRVLFK
jgi:hypothetical protein